MKSHIPTARSLLPLLAASALFTFSTAQAALVVPAGNPLVVNDTDMNIAWTQDANLFKTMAATDPNLVSKIAAVTPTYNDPWWGLQTIDAGDFDTSTGRMTWWGGQAWVNYLDSVSYAGQTGWRLPVVTPVSGFSFNYSQSTDGSTDWGYNTTAVNATASELPHVYYNELGNLGYRDTNGNIQPNYGLTNMGPFQNLESYVYWSGTEYGLDPYYAWPFDTAYGFQGTAFYKTFQFYGWAVRPGQIAAVPVPAAAWLMGSALIGLLGFGRRKAAASVIRAIRPFAPSPSGKGHSGAPGMTVCDWRGLG